MMVLGKRKHILFWFLLLALLFIASSVMPVYAGLLQEKQQERQEISRELEKERKNLRAQQDREQALKQELKELDRNLAALKEEQNRLSREIARTEEEIAQTEEELEEAEERLERQDNLLKRRVRAIYERGSVTYYEVLLNATSFSDFLTRLIHLRTIAANDMRLLKEFQAERDRIQAEKVKLEQRRNELESMRRQSLAKEQEIQRTMSTREAVLADLQQEIASRIKAIQELEQEAQRLDNLIKQLISESNLGGVVGKMAWPVQAPYWISSGFGWRSDPFTGAKSYHGGIDIATYGGYNPVFAAADGKVIFSGISTAGGSYNTAPGYDAGRSGLTGYGSYIMIDHGGGTVTVYGHLSQRFVAVGQVVTRGQQIGRVGSTGYSTGPHLHFEVREYEKAPYRYYSSGAPDYRYNPMNYF
jgi:murein DD-endopeptidase MepM/ murein hydrolase activator NlpD